MPLRVVIFVDRPDWHARRLWAAFAARRVEAVFRSLRQCGFALGNDTGLNLPGFAEDLPDAALVRSVPAGSFEQVTLRLSVLHALRECGVTVCNDARAIERCVDKGMTNFLLQRAEIPTPTTWVCESLERARLIAAREAAPGRPLVLKPLFGSQGRGLKLIEGPADLPPEEELAGVYYLQRFVPVTGEGWRDFRIFVVGRRAVAGMIRHGRGWITNAKQGAACEGIAVEGELAELAVAAAAAVGAAYAGVDIIRGRDGGYSVLEVNSMPAWSALQRVSRLDVAEALVEALLTELAPGRPKPARGAPLRRAAGA